MFDLKKRNSLTLNCSRDSEEFRRVAVRRKVKGAAGDCQAAQAVVSSGVCGSYSCGRSCEMIRGSAPSSKHGAEDNEDSSPAKPSPFKPQVPPKPAHLQSPLRAAADKPLSPPCDKNILHGLNGAEEEPSPRRGGGLSVFYVSPSHTRQASPNLTVAARGGTFLSGAQTSPGRRRQGIPKLTSSPTLGSPSPGKRGFHSVSPLREGGHSPAKLSPRSRSPLAGKLRTPSPVQGRMGSYNAVKNSKSWLGLHRIPSSKMEAQEKRAGKSVSVPDLVVYLDESRIPERSPLTPLQSSNGGAPPVPLGAPANHRPSVSAGDTRPQTPSAAECPLQTDVLGTAPCRGHAKKSDCSCQWTATAPPAGESVHRRATGAQSGQETGGEESTDQKLLKIASELLQTEQAYVARLHLLDQVFCSRLKDEAARGSFPPEVIRSIFSNISSIYSFHSQFLLPDLQKCISCWCERPGLGHVLLQHAPFLRMYADYVRNFDQAVELVRTWTERSSAFRAIIQDIQSQEVCGSLTLQHHMLEPVQRVPRYELLLRDYLRNLPEDDPDYQLAQKSLQTISMAATHSNSAIHQAEKLKRLLEIYEMVGEEEVVNPTNEFLREGRLLKLAARNTSAMERHLFLFNNFLLCCTPKFSLVGQRFTVRCRIGVDGMEVQPTANEDHPCTFQVSGKEKTLELEASSEEDRDQWIKVIQGAVDEFQKKHQTFKLASKEPSVEGPTEELGRRAPRWIRDNEVTACMKCREPFNALTRRRHHCRACGCVVCWKCSDNKVPLEYDGNKMNKVCKDCYSILTAQRGERAEGRKRPLLEDPSDAISGFLQYGDHPKTCQRMWSVVRGTEPPVLHLFAPFAPQAQDVKPVCSIPLLGCSVDPAPPQLPGQWCFSVSQSGSTHTFSCHASDLQRRWLAALSAAATGTRPACPPTDHGIGGVRGGEGLVVNGN